METYLVGGAVRDKLLGLPVAERDWVVVGATPQQLLALGYTPVGKDFPVFLHPQSREEYALARTERKTAPGYTGFVFNTDPSVTLEEDLRRRDLTINAMAETAHGELIDPWGGRDDLDNALLKHVSPAFAEDPVRILRVARFAARFAHYGFHVAHGTNQLMRAMVSDGEVDALVAERIWAELYKALDCNTPARFFSVLTGCGALEKILPEVAAIRQATHTTHEHAMPPLPVLESAAQLSHSVEQRFAALVCDLDNGTDGGFTPDRLDTMCERLRVPTRFRELAGKALSLRSRLHALASLDATARLDLLLALDAFRRSERIADVVAVCAAEAHSRDSTAHDYPPARLLERIYLAATAVKADTSGKSGKEIGEALRAQRIAAIENLSS
jgi:tRNA nucleotidyltransferase (CCA-adding enzyme)